MPRIRVLIAEDSLTVRKQLADVLGASPDIEVVGEAEDGKQAIELCMKLRPDVVTLDMMMPVMTGLAATEYIMAYCPTPIVIVSASTNRGELFRTYEALAAGALDVLEKPRGNEQPDEWERKLLATVKLASRIKVITHPRARLGLSATKSTPLPIESKPQEAGLRVAAIGASTGGPSAIVSVLQALPANFPLPVLLVMHLSHPFASAFAEWLDGQLSMDVRYAKDGEELPPPGTPCALMAPPDQHLIVRQGRLHLTSDPEVHFCRPSVDVLFRSLAREMGSRCVACLLTGMGRDGAEGLLDIRRAGGTTIAQDEASSVVYGMPREAAVIGAAERILPLNQIGYTLSTLARTTSGGART